MALTTEVSFRGLDELRRALKSDELLEEPVRDAINSTMLAGLKVSRKAAKPHSGDTGELARNTKSELMGRGIPDNARLYNNLDRAAANEFGRPPGRMPPVEPIAAWLRRHGGDPDNAFIVARAIGRRGTQGLKYMDAGRREIERVLPGFIRQAQETIKSIFESRTR